MSPDRPIFTTRHTSRQPLTGLLLPPKLATSFSARPSAIMPVDIPKMMRAVVMYEPGGPEVLKLEELPVPTPKAGEVLIKVMAAGVNRSEMFTRQGHSPSVKFPRVLGIEASGIIAACPDGTFTPGERIITAMAGLGRAHDGGYAEYTLVRTSAARRVGETSLPWDVLGALPEMVQTAWGSLHEALGIEKGDRLLVRGGTASVGLCAIALAKAAGCHVTGTSRSAKSQDQLFAAGADAVLIDDGNLAAQLGDGTKFNKILELVGASTLRDSLACCARPTPGRGSLGLVCMVGFTGGQWWLDAGFEPMTDIPSGVALCGYTGGPSEFGRTPYDQIVRQIEEGKLKLPVARTLKLEEVQKAHEFMEKGGAGGKMVLLME